MPGKYVDNPACGDKVTSGGARPFYRAKPNNRTWDKKTVHEHRAHTIRYAVALCNDYIYTEYRWIKCLTDIMKNENKIMSYRSLSDI